MYAAHTGTYIMSWVNRALCCLNFRKDFTSFELLFDIPFKRVDSECVNKILVLFYVARTRLHGHHGYFARPDGDCKLDYTLSGKTVSFASLTHKVRRSTLF